MNSNRSYLCECTHPFSYHKEALDPWTVFGPGFGDCKGYVGSHTPNTIRPCSCSKFRAFDGPWDARTGEPIKPFTLSEHKGK